MRALRQSLTCQSGAAALEFAIVSLFLVLISIGVVDFGRGLYVRNHMSYAADKGARSVLIDVDAPAAEIESTVRDAFAGPEPERLDVTIGSETVGTTSYRTLTLVYTLALRIPGLTATPVELSVVRRVPAA